MGKKERVFPLTTIGGRIYELRNKLGFNSPSGRVDFYNFVFDNEKISNESKSKNVYNWECKEDTIPIDVIKKICEKCDCSSDYLLGIEKERNHDLHFICNYTGLTEDAINCLHMLHTPLDPSCLDSAQDSRYDISRYDIIALNIILEDLYTNFKNEEEWRMFSADSILNQIGQYIDSNSVNFGIETPIFSQNGKTGIFSQGEMAREMFKTRIFDSLRHLYEKYSRHISGKRDENKEYFKKCFEDYVRSFYNKKN